MGSMSGGVEAITALVVTGPVSVGSVAIKGEDVSVEIADEFGVGAASCPTAGELSVWEHAAVPAKASIAVSHTARFETGIKD